MRKAGGDGWGQVRVHRLCTHLLPHFPYTWARVQSPPVPAETTASMTGHPCHSHFPPPHFTLYLGEGAVPASAG